MNDASVMVLTTYDDKLIAGGYFYKAGGVDANRIAQWDGNSWEALGSGMNAGVYALTAYKGELIAGGQFKIADNNPSMYWARWGVAEPIEGDLNHDCSVDLYDFALLAQQWRNSDCMYNGWCYEADLNYDFKVDFEDFDNMADNWLAGE
jgi:hypothetical protein